MDKIVIRGLKCELRIGVEPEERRYPQICLVDLEMKLSLRTAARTDSVKDTVDYAQLCEEIQRIAAEREYYLVESFANAVTDAALAHRLVQQVRVFVEETPLPLQGKLQ